MRDALRLASAALLLAGTLFPGVAAAAQPAPSLHITGSGEFVARRDLGPWNAAPGDTAPGSGTSGNTGPSGAAPAQGSDTVIMVEDPHIVSRTSRIEARLCHRFGFMFTLENPGPDGTLDVTVTSMHPPITHPNGRVSTGVTYPMSVSSEKPGLVGFSFDDPWELVAGPWTFTVRAGSRVLAEQRFDVTVPVEPDPSAGRTDCNAVVS